MRKPPAKGAFLGFINIEENRKEKQGAEVK
jgi:hypothetical protein